MKIEDVQELARIMTESGLTCLEIMEGERKVRLEKRQPAVRVVSEPVPIHSGESQARNDPAASAAAEKSGYKEVKSPMVGVFYTSPSPESEPYVKVGSQVQKGDVLCVIEAMKLLNELNCDMDGVIAEVCVSNGQVVEYGQTLFKLK